MPTLSNPSIDDSKIKLYLYGRNIQKMIDHCKTIADRDERTRCAYTIVQTMGNILPNIKKEPNADHILWDHFHIMAGEELDIDYPFEVTSREQLQAKPERLDYQLEPIKMRHYGKIIQKMVERAAQYPNGEEKDVLIYRLANHMKKQMFAISKEGVDDDKILKDLRFYSNGAIDLDAQTYHLRRFVEEVKPQPTQKKKKK